MKYFFLKLVPPRPDFMKTMSEAARNIMIAHQGHWQRLTERGWAVAYGPVADPAGGYGAGFWALPNGEDPTRLSADDPAINANVGFRYEISPMPALVTGKPSLQ